MIPFLTGLYLACAMLLCAYTAGSAVLLLLFLLTRREDSPPAPLTVYPTVTVQLPVYNERYVVARLLDAVSRLDYPRERLTIQLLDDSDDETSIIAAHQVRRLRARGVPMQHIRRQQRTGYKAGALAAGMLRAPADYYAIFDADFVPPPDFLKRTLPYLECDPQLGMVEGRWGHLNPHQNPVTAAQAMAIDGHFVIEQTARSRAGLLLNFNGTGGVWRASCIHEAGGWHADTLTEDFDLSYRAQLRGWRMRLLPDLVVPGELPVQLATFKQQQFRWAQGSTQVLMRMLLPLWRTGNLSLPQRVMGTLHLWQYLPYPMLLLLALLAPPLLLSGVFAELPLAFLTFSGVVPPLLYGVSQWAGYDDWGRRMLAFPSLVLFGTGIALSNTVAMLAAFARVGGAFQRTPKTGGQAESHYHLGDDVLLYFELLVALYVAWGAWLALQLAPHAAPYLALSAVSYGSVALGCLWEQVQSYRQSRRLAAHRSLD